MDDDIGPMFDRPHEVGARKRVVDDQRQAMLSGDIADPLDVDEFAARVRQALDEYPARLVVDLALEGSNLAGVGPAHLPAEIPEGLTKLVDRTAVKLSRRNEILARPHEAVEDQKLCSVT